MGYLIRPLRGHLPLKGKAGGCHFKAFPFRGRWLAEGQTDEAGGQRPPAGRRGRRPLRQNRKIPPSRRGGTLGRPETARWGHRALQKIKRTFGYAVGAGALTRPPQRIPPLVGAAHRTARKRPDGDIGPYKRSKAPIGYAVGAAPCGRPPFLDIRRGAQCAPACRRGRRPLRQNRKIPPSRRGGCPHPPASEDSSTRRGGTLGRPETARWGHRALQKIKRTFGYAVGAGALTRPPQRIPPLVGAAHRTARKRPDGGIGPYKRSKAPSDTP